MLGTIPSEIGKNLKLFKETFMFFIVILGYIKLNIVWSVATTNLIV